MGQETLLIEAFLCSHSSISRSCLQSPHEAGDQEERRLADTVCRQHYSNYTLPSLGPLLVPSGCKCYEIKYF